MDNADNNIFATGTSGPESNPDGSGDKPTGTDASIEGRIDPAIARGTAEVGATGAGTGDSDNGGNAPGPATGEPAAAVRRGRGRPPGPTKTAAEKGEARSVRVSFIEKTLFAIHIGVAKMAKAPEFEIEKDDAKLLAEAVAGVLALHKIRMTPSQEAYAVLLEAAAQIYPPMFVSVYFRKKMEAERRGQNAPPKPQPAPPPFPTAKPVDASVKPPGFDATAPHMPAGFDPGNISIPDG